MSPQLTIQQLEHAISVYEKRVEAKKLEVDSYALLRDHSPAAFGAFSMMLPTDASDAVEAQVLDAMSHSLGIMRHAIVNLFATKHTVATLDLEDLELNLKGMRQMRSGVVGASRVIDPFKPNQRH
jgi:hypothetical protein